MKKYNNIKDPELETIPSSVLRSQVELPLLRQQLKHITTHSLFYKNKLGKIFKKENSLYRNFDKIPFTYKKDIIDDQVKYPPFGSNLCTDLKHIIRVHKTSGTTNRPVIIAMTQSDVNAAIASGSRCFWASGLRPHHTVVHCLNYCLWMGGYTDHQSLEATGATVVPYGVGNSKALLSMIRDIKINSIHCTPSYMTILEDLVSRELSIKPKKLGLKLGLFGGELGIQNTVFRRYMESLWGFKAMNANYGMADVFSMFGAECHKQNGLHFMGQGNVMVELINPLTEKILPIEKGVQGELVITNLNRKAQPVIRFRTKDLVEIIEHNMCSCKRKSFRFNLIGRTDDMLVVKGVNVFPSQIKNTLTKFLDRVTGNFQIILESQFPLKRLRLKIEYRNGAINKIKENLIKAIKYDFEAEIGVKPSIALVQEGTLPRTQGKSKIVVRKYKK